MLTGKVGYLLYFKNYLDLIHNIPNIKKQHDVSDYDKEEIQKWYYWLVDCASFLHPELLKENEWFKIYYKENLFGIQVYEEQEDGSMVFVRNYLFSGYEENNDTNTYIHTFEPKSWMYYIDTPSKEKLALFSSILKSLQDSVHAKYLAPVELYAMAYKKMSEQDTSCNATLRYKLGVYYTRHGDVPDEYKL